MRVLMVSAEISPFAKTGGLAEVVGMMSGSLARHGVCSDLIMPMYESIDKEKFNITPTGKTLSIDMDGRPVTGSIWSCPLPSGGCSGCTAYFIENDSYYGRPDLYGNEEGDYSDNCERFAFFCKAVLTAVGELNLEPDVIHCHDWHSSLIPIYLKKCAEQYGNLKAKSLLTIHNLAYQGTFWHWDWPTLGLDWSLFGWQGMEFYGKLNFLKGGIIFADAVSTVSKTYSQEIQSPEFGCGLEGVLKNRRDNIHGIVNGLDYDVWNPEGDGVVEQTYSIRDLSGKRTCKLALQKECGLEEDGGVPVVAMVGRLAEQKGLDLLSECFDSIMSLPLQLVILGDGNRHYVRMLSEYCRRYNRKAHLRVAFDTKFSHRVFSGSDIFLMPSRFEPCGLSQLIAMRYGTVPVVHDTGGLSDTVIDLTPEGLEDGTSTGFVFLEYNVASLYDELARAIWNYSDAVKWEKLQINCMKKDWSFHASARSYKALYERLIQI